MTDLSYPGAILLGIVQGVTEFLPISSDGHLALVEHLLGLRPESPEMIAFDLALHVGTLLPMALFFAPAFGRFLRRLLAESRQCYQGRRAAWPIVGLTVVAGLLTAVVGFGGKRYFEEAYASRLCLALGLIGTGVLLVLTRWAPRARRGWRNFGWPRAALIGLAQGLAILPGLSRSGSTISLAMLTGVRRRWAGQFSFLIAFPAILAATALQAREMLQQGAAHSVAPGMYAAGAGAAAIAGYFALAGLMALLRRARLHYFAYYCWLLAAFVLVFMC